MRQDQMRRAPSREITRVVFMSITDGQFSKKKKKTKTEHAENSLTSIIIFLLPEDKTKTKIQRNFLAQQFVTILYQYDIAAEIYSI